MNRGIQRDHDPRPLRAVVITIAVVAPVLAVTATLLVLALTNAQRDAFETRAVEEARTVLMLIPDDIDGPDAQRFSRDLRRPEIREVVVVTSNGTVARSSREISLADVPPPGRPEDGRPFSARTDVGGQRVLVVGGPVETGGSRVYLFFSERPLEKQRQGTTQAVALGSLLVLVLAAGGGWLRSDRCARALALSRRQERDYTAHLAHELRTPVGVLVTAASLVDTSQLAKSPEQLRQPVETLLVQTRRLRKIVEDLLELSRLEAGHLELQLEPVDLEQVVAEIVTSYGWDAMHVETSGSTMVEADRQSLTRLTLNLLANARHHARTRVQITIRGTPAGVVLDVADDGPGLDPEHAAVLTHPDRARTPPHGRERHGHGPGHGLGHGLGLWITRFHAELLGADLDVEANDRGTRVIVHLPPASAAVEADRPPPVLRP